MKPYFKTWRRALHKQKNRLEEKIQTTSLRAFFLLTLCFVLGFWTIRLVNIHYNGYDLAYAGYSYYHSDDTAQPNVLWDWQQGNRQGAVVGDDNWSIKYPLYVLTNNLPVSPLKRLFVNSWVVLMSTASLLMTAFYLFSKSLIKDKGRQRLALVLSGLSLAVVPTQAFGVIKMSNSRNIELGIFMLLLFALYSYEHVPTFLQNHGKQKLLGLVVLAGILCADDPMFLYMGVLPLSVITALAYFLGHIGLRRALNIAAFITATIFATMVGKLLLLTLLPIRFAKHTTTIAQFDSVLTNLRAFFTSSINMVGLDIFGRDPKRPSTWLVLVTLIIFCIVLGSLISKRRQAKKSLFYSLILLLWAWVPVLNMVSSLSQGAGSSRYLIMLSILVPLLVVLAVTQLKLKRQVVVLTSLIIISVILSVGFELKGLAHRARPNARTLNQIQSIKDLGLKRGYGELWEEGIAEYLSDHTLVTAPVICSEAGELEIHDLFFDRASLAQPVDKSFYMYNPNRLEFKDCNPDSLVKQFGKPSLVTPEKDAIQIVVYDYDIGTKMNYDSN